MQTICASGSSCIVQTTLALDCDFSPIRDNEPWHSHKSSSARGSSTQSSIAPMLSRVPIAFLREALQKYPEQSFAQKFSLYNRQKFSGAKLKRAFEELPKRATALNGGSRLPKSKERFAGGLPTERNARFGKVSKRRRGGLRKAFSDAVFGCKSLRSAGQGVKRTAPDRSGAA